LRRKEGVSHLEHIDRRCALSVCSALWQDATTTIGLAGAACPNAQCPHHAEAKSSMHRLAHKRDFYAGGLMVLFGLVAAIKGPGYKLGTLMHMGPGFLPTALGVILICLGVVIAGTALTTPDGGDERILPEEPQWLGWLCILAGPLLFILFGRIGGMIPGTFACVFVAALGDRTSTWRGALTLATVVTAFGVLLFSYVLKIPMPILEWRGL
jgi:hypothetical protein